MDAHDDARQGLARALLHDAAVQGQRRHRGDRGNDCGESPQKLICDGITVKLGNVARSTPGEWPLRRACSTSGTNIPRPDTYVIGVDCRPSWGSNWLMIAPDTCPVDHWKRPRPWKSSTVSSTRRMRFGGTASSRTATRVNERAGVTDRNSADIGGSCAMSVQLPCGIVFVAGSQFGIGVMSLASWYLRVSPMAS